MGGSTRVFESQWRGLREKEIEIEVTKKGGYGGEREKMSEDSGIWRKK